MSVLTGAKQGVVKNIETCGTTCVDESMGRWAHWSTDGSVEVLDSRAIIARQDAKDTEPTTGPTKDVTDTVQTRGPTPRPTRQPTQDVTGTVQTRGPTQDGRHTAEKIGPL